MLHLVRTPLGEAIAEHVRHVAVRLLQLVLVSLGVQLMESDSCLVQGPCGKHLVQPNLVKAGSREHEVSWALVQSCLITSELSHHLPHSMHANCTEGARGYGPTSSYLEFCADHARTGQLSQEVVATCCAYLRADMASSLL